MKYDLTKLKSMPIPIEDLDEGIRDAVVLLNKYGFSTWESCQGGDGHCTGLPFIKFWGEEFELLQAYELCEMHGMNVLEAERVYHKTSVLSQVTDGHEVGQTWDTPYNKLTFVIHSKTGTIYRPA